MTNAVAVAARRRQPLDRAARWARRHPVITYVLAMTLATVVAWACEYATGGVPVALCHLREMLQHRLGEVIETALRNPLKS